MLAFVTAIALGAYISNRVSIFRDGEILTATIDYAAVWQDAIALFAALGSLCNWVIGLARLARVYTDCVLLPWLNKHSVKTSLTAIALPTTPTDTSR